MADLRALVTTGGRTQQVAAADSLVVGAGIKTAAGNLTITPAGTDILIGSGKNLTSVGGTSAIDFSAGSGIFKTSTGAVTIGPGATTMSGAVTLTAAGTALTINNDAVITGVTNVNGGVQRSTSGSMSIGTTSNTTTVTISRTGQNTVIGGNLIVNGTTTTTHSDTVLIDDNHLFLNNGYTVAVAQTGGLVVNYLPTATATTVNAAYVAGVAATSNPTVGTVGAATFAAGDLIQISSSANNSGLYEVLTHAANVLTIRGIGVTATVEDFTQNQFVAEASDGATITKVTVSVMRSGTDGIWETGAGAVTPITFTDVSTGLSTVLSIPGTAGEALVASNVVSFDDAAGSPRVFKADANGAGELVNVAGFAIAAASGGAAVNVQVGGQIAIPDALWDSVPGTGDVGKVVFLSETAGNITLTAPTTSGSTIQKVGLVTIGGTGAVKIGIQIGDGILI